jgi:hypothetical protein
MKHIWIVERKSITFGWVLIGAYETRADARQALSFHSNIFECRVRKFIPSDQQ